ncbi:MAG: tetratricopeptide repeat protein [Planctomycetota bacterium]|nr:tetratricopeptide repeat protein [Planctomycetota bacterium]
MNTKIYLAVTIMALMLLTGCATQTIRPISQQVVIDSEESHSTILDVKLEKYNKLASDFPNEPRYQERLARIYWQQSDHDSALKALKKAQKIDPGNPRYNFIAAQIFEGIGSYTAAEKAYLAVIEASDGKEFSGPLLQLALLYIQMEKRDLAFQYLEECLEVDPIFAEPHYWIGRIHMSNKKREQAIQSFERYLRVGGTNRQKEVLQTLQALQPDLRIHDIR